MEMVKKMRIESGSEVSSSYTFYCSQAEASALMVLLGMVFSNYSPELPSSIRDSIKEMLTESEQLLLVRMMWTLIRQY